MGERPHKAIVLSSAITANLAGGAILGMFTGKYVDKLVSSEPLFSIIGLLVGVVAGIIGMVTTVKKFTEAGEENDQ